MALAMRTLKLKRGIWEDPWFAALSDEDKLLWFRLLTSSNDVGLVELPAGVTEVRCVAAFGHRVQVLDGGRLWLVGHLDWQDPKWRTSNRVGPTSWRRRLETEGLKISEQVSTQPQVNSTHPRETERENAGLKISGLPRYGTVRYGTVPCEAPENQGPVSTQPAPVSTQPKVLVSIEKKLEKPSSTKETLESSDLFGRISKPTEEAKSTNAKARAVESCWDRVRNSIHEGTGVQPFPSNKGARACIAKLLKDFDEDTIVLTVQYKIAEWLRKDRMKPYASRATTLLNANKFADYATQARQHASQGKSPADVYRSSGTGFDPNDELAALIERRRRETEGP